MTEAMKHRPLVMGEGPKPAVGMIIGEAPGYHEQLEGRPFVGASGRLLESALKIAGASREQFYITNVYKLRPPENRDPAEDELADHSSYLRSELLEVNPSYLLVLGAVAGRYIFGNSFSVSRERGIWQDVEGKRGLPTFHPAYILYNGGFDSDPGVRFLFDIQEFVDACLG